MRGGLRPHHSKTFIYIMRRILFAALAAMSVLTVSAQLEVTSAGNVIAGTQLKSNNSTWNLGLQSGVTSSSQFPMAVGLYGRSDCSSSSGLIFGVMGVATNTAGSCGYGVTGCLNNTTMTGAGVLGSLEHEGTMGLPGRYAGFFSGNTKVIGAFEATTITATSDLRLKENITSLESREGSTLDKVLNMNVVEYNFKKKLPSVILPDSVSEEEMVKRLGIDTEKRHIGLIAQELKELYPNLVEEGQDGYLSVNYIELVPVLIRSIQELKQELDEVKGATEDARMSRGDVSSVSTVRSNGNILYQNTPNPFKEKTFIRFRLADDAKESAVCIFDMSGKLLKKLPVSSGMESVAVNGYELGEGMFLYTLLVNGREVDTKRMILSH